MKTKACLVMSAALLSAVSLQASVIAYDGFAGYGTGDIVGNGQGSGWSGNWFAESGAATNFDYDATGLTYPGVAVSGGAMVASADAASALARNFDPGSNTTLWFSWLYRSTTPANLQGVLIRNASESPNYMGLWVGGGWPNAGTASILGSQVLNSSFVNVAGGEFPGSISATAAVVSVVVRADINTSGNDTVRIWVNNRDINDLTNNTNVTQSFTAAVWGSGNTPNQVRLYNPGGALYDEFTVGSTAAAVIPEPGTLGLVGLMAAALLLTRRR